MTNKNIVQVVHTQPKPIRNNVQYIIIYDNSVIAPYSNSLEQKKRYDVITDEEWYILVKVWDTSW